ncbi:MAG: metallophosphoesterase [Promethearchaeota archaeon]
MSERKNNTVIIITSDAHLGSLDPQSKLFKEFLERINSGLYGDLKALIILGDFLDLCFKNWNYFADHFKKIFELLENIYKNENIHLLFTLGNHEIPVTVNPLTGKYYESFENCKKYFLSKLRNSGFNYNFINEDNVFQYFILQKKKNSVPKLLFCDYIDQINHYYLGEIVFDEIHLEDGFTCLMTHGYQFDGSTLRYFVAHIWKALIDSNDEEIKEKMNRIWNTGIKNNKFSKVKFKDLLVKDFSLKNFLKKDFSLKKIEFDLIKYVKKWEKALRKAKNYDSQVKKFLENKDYDFSNITHVIFGHSHVKQNIKKLINFKEVSIINDGAWLRISTPSFVEIRSNGDVELLDFEG